MSKTFIAISGSTRKDSYNSLLLKAVVSLAPSDVTIDIVDITDISLFSQDLEANFPPSVQALKDKITASDGVIFATPEYNRSIPGVLKNVIDWVSRPYGQSAFVGKSALVLGASMTPGGTMLAQYHLKQVLLHLDMQVIGQPEIFVAMAQDKFDATGTLTDETIKGLITKGLAVLDSK
jgi:chromate reductase